MVKACGFGSMDELIDATVPAAIRRKERMNIGRFSDGLTEQEFLTTFKWVPTPPCLELAAQSAAWCPDACCCL